MGAERDGDVGADVRPVEPAGVDIDPGRYVDRDHGRARERSRPRRSASGRRPGRPPIPTIPSTTTSGGAAASAVTTRPPAARSAATPSSWALSDEQHRLDTGPAPRQQRPGVQRVAAVVTRTRRAAAPGRRTPARAGRATATASPRRRPLHQRALRQPRHQGGLRRPHLLHRVCLLMPRGIRASRGRGRDPRSGLEDDDGARRCRRRGTARGDAARRRARRRGRRRCRASSKTGGRSGVA